MNSPLFNILEQNLGIPDVDRGDVVPCLKKQGAKRRRKTSQRVIDCYLIANELVKSDMSRIDAARLVAAKYNIGFSNLYNKWERIEAAAKAQQS